MPRDQLNSLRDVAAVAEEIEKRLADLDNQSGAKRLREARTLFYTTTTEALEGIADALEDVLPSLEHGSELETFAQWALVETQRLMDLA